MTQTNLIWCPISCAFTNNQKNGQKSTGPSYPCAKKCTFCDENIYLTKIFRKITHKPPRKWIPCSKLERKQVKKFTIKSPLLQQKNVAFVSIFSRDWQRNWFLIHVSKQGTRKCFLILRFE